MLRSWLGFVALAAGLLHIALTVGSPIVVALALLLVGAAEFAWGVFTIARPAPPLPQVARIGAVIPVIAWALLLLVAGADRFGPLTSAAQLFPMLVASLFDLLVAIGLTVLLRRSTESPAPDAAPATTTPSPSAHPARHLVGVIAGALVVAAITTPALAATEVTSVTSGPFVGHTH